MSDRDIIDIALADIIPNRFQPREVFDEESLKELASSITTHGVVQPIIVRKAGDKFEIIAGERRYRASLLAGKTTIPSIVKNYDDNQAAKVALLENLQRKDLSAIEEARTFQTILSLDNITQEELASSLGCSQSTIANKLRLLNLDDTVQLALLNEKISERHARSLLNIASKEKQKEMLTKVILNRMTVKQLDDEIEELQLNIIPSKDDIIIDPVKKEAPVVESIIPTVDPISSKSIKDLEEKYGIVDYFNHPEYIKEYTPEKEIETLKEKEIESIIEDIEELDNPEPNFFDSLRKMLDQEEKEKITIKEPELEVLEDDPSTEIENLEEILPKKNLFNIGLAINDIRKAVKQIEKFGYTVETEETDFENIFQFNIKIEK